MKKAILIIIVAIYLLSIAFVNLFGMQMATYNEVVYAESVEFADDRISVDLQTGNKLLILEYVGPKDTYYPFSWNVLPADTTDKSVTFSLTVSKDIAEISDRGFLIINAASYVKALTVKVYTSGGGAAHYDEVMVLLRRPQ
ncbi:MAG: hypothetical protein LBS99_03220 [Clostridiales bacterium]|jgi:hypothetical protein|nr:hypothetical protein [Clostridiales bacterium]